MNLKNRTIFITGASRGIGRAIALKCAADGANIVIAAKSAEPRPGLEGTIHSVAEEVEAAGGKALPLEVDVRDEAAILAAAEKAANHFGGIDVVINNASAIKLKSSADVSGKDFDLMLDVNARGTFFTVQACLPYLKASDHAHVITLSPPINMNPKWLGAGPAYMLSKYGMTLLTLGFAAEFKAHNIHCNTIWPQTLIATAAIKVNFPQMYDQALKPEIVADATYALLSEDHPLTGHSFTDQEILRAAGVDNFDQYHVSPDVEPQIDFFLD
ncbi:MAG: NAD(P)-dependent oxidoreductase [Pseudomonadota bacterium]|jgi:citronellol/citronellal dehydrogenase|nr:NAD(P)-dependent oxidoreductase [Pseudomonadota bacterium]MEC7701686.1 NAD(P)-dependent oxidoreductase [Pseudomonadota bacterium]MEC9236540.1 NAD(P)-dependent oxidoreductase [Pseudomonadota bacterium]MEE3323107.1 NAD(P)-dependent oxidoreductase [Pseudomonadota bacterium]